MNQKDIDRLTKEYSRIFGKAQAKVISAILSSEKYSVDEKDRILNEINEILGNLQETSDKWIDRNIPKLYNMGANDTIKVLAGIGILGLILKTPRENEAIKNIVDSTKVSINEAISGMNRSSSRILSKATEARIKSLISEGKVSRESYKQIGDMVAGQLKKQAVFITDSAGRKWDIVNYSEMFTKTTLMNSYNNGVANQMMEHNHDLAYVTSYGACKCDVCLSWEGKVLSLTGKTPGYPSLEQAYADGLFHPNCKHRMRPFIE
jgi:hypothetical protein